MHVHACRACSMTGHSKDPRSPIALGVRTHSGWAAYVVLGGKISEPNIVSRGLMRLCDSNVDGAKQPYHHAEPMPFQSAEAFIARCKVSSRIMADEVLREIVANYGALKGCCILTASGRPLPALRDILASHALIHAAEGVFY